MAPCGRICKAGKKSSGSVLNTIIALGIMHALDNVVVNKEPVDNFTFPNGTVYSIQNEHNRNMLEINTTTGNWILILFGLAIIVLGTTMAYQKWGIRGMCGTNKMCTTKKRNQNKSEETPPAMEMEEI